MDVDALIAQGKLAEAAVELRVRGEFGRAQALFEKLWDFQSAAKIAVERGDRPDALRLYLEARLLGEAATLGRQIATGAPDERERTATIYEQRHMWADAAALRENLGELDRAHALYEKGLRPLDAARIDEARGRQREAGLAYERFLSIADVDSVDAAHAHERLGALLIRLGRNEDAVRHLQKAMRAPLSASAARPNLVYALAQLGLRIAADQILSQMRADDDPNTPSLDAFVAQYAAQIAEQSDSTVLGSRYRVRALLGSGGMGRVYLAFDELTGDRVALKVMAPPIDPRSRTSYEKFIREARVVAALDHPHIARVIEFHEALGLLALRYMPGGTLADRLASRVPLGAGQVKRIALELISALEAAHALGVIHRDIKPANIFFSEAGGATLGDFGVAHLQDLGATQTAGFIGTLAYMSPEQISGAPLSFASDQYALGVTLFQALTGSLPFAGPDFVGQHLGEAAPKPSVLSPALSPKWDSLIARALEKNPTNRFATLDDLRRALFAIQVNTDTSAQKTERAPQSPGGDNHGDDHGDDHGDATSAPPARFLIATELSHSSASALFHATDTRLGRQVALERFSPDYLLSSQGAKHLAWLRGIAALGAPFQRILALETEADGGAQVIFEAVSGVSRSPTQEEITYLSAALDNLWARRLAHGSLDRSLVFDDLGATILVAGRSPSDLSPAEEQATWQKARS